MANRYYRVLSRSRLYIRYSGFRTGGFVLPGFLTRSVCYVRSCLHENRQVKMYNLCTGNATLFMAFHNHGLHKKMVKLVCSAALKHFKEPPTMRTCLQQH